MLTSLALFAGLLVPLVLAAPIVDKVITPAGYRANANMFQIPEGGTLAHVGSEIHVLSADGTIVHKATRGGPTRVKGAAAPLETGWITYADWLNTGASPISSFTTTWTVPEAPQTNHGQTVFLFNSIEPAAGDAILQPVLQFGPSAAGGGASWAVATWYLDSQNTFFTTLVPVSAGQTLDGVITLTSSAGSSFNYNSQFSNVARTSLAVTGAAELVWATETLEAYGITAISDYPAGATEFSGINLKLASGATPTVAWAHVNDAADGLSTTINTNGASGAVITIKY